MIPSTLILAQYRFDSAYSDVVGTQYHFPRKYKNMMSLPQVHFLYFEPKKKGEGVFFGYGRVGEISSDPSESDHYFATVEDFRAFPYLVSGYKDDGTSIEPTPFYNSQNAVRRIDSDLFHEICRRGGLKLKTWSY